MEIREALSVLGSIVVTVMFITTYWRVIKIKKMLEELTQKKKDN